MNKELIEKVQGRGDKNDKRIRKAKLQGKVKVLNLSTLEEKRVMGDMITVF